MAGNAALEQATLTFEDVTVGREPPLPSGAGSGRQGLRMPRLRQWVAGTG